MDKTPKFIKMSDCPEIQGQWKPKWGDFVLDDGSIFPLSTVRIDKEDVIWIPRQDQLQDMIGNIPWRLELVKTNKGDDYYFEFCFLTGFEYWVGSTPEQAIIQGIMQKKFNKVWDDKKEEWDN